MGIEEDFGCLVRVLEAVIVSKAIVPADVIGELEASHIDNLAESNAHVQVIDPTRLLVAGDHHEEVLAGDQCVYRQVRHVRLAAERNRGLFRTECLAEIQLQLWAELLGRGLFYHRLFFLRRGDRFALALRLGFGHCEKTATGCVAWSRTASTIGAGRAVGKVAANGRGGPASARPQQIRRL